MNQISEGSVWSKAYLLQWILVLLPSLLPLFLWKYGLEVADSGWASVLTRDYFERPNMAGQAAPWFLTWTIGALLSHGSGMQVGQLRIFTFIPILASAVATWAVFSAYGYRTWVAAIGVFSAGLAAYSSFCLLNYNNLSAAFSVLAFSSLLLSASSAKRERCRLTLCALGGIFLSCAIFSRLASLTMLAPAAYILVAFYRRDVGKYFVFLSGLAFGAISVALFASYTGHLPYIRSNLTEFLASALNNTNPSHTRGQILNSFGATAVFAFTQAAALFVTCAFAFDKIKRREHLAFVGALLFGAYYVIQIRGNITHVFPALLVLMLFLQPDSWEKRNTLKPLVVIGAMFAMLFPLGSTNGFSNCTFSLWFLIPSAMLALDSARDRFTAFGTLTLFSGILIVRSFTNPYWDSAVSKLNAEVESKYAKNIRTTPARKAVLDGVTSAVARYAAVGDEIFVYQNSPMIYVLTGTKPWIPYPWPFVISAAKMERAMQEKEAVSLPKIIVRERLSPFNNQWPNSDILPAQSISGEMLHSPIYERFIKKHGYQLVFQNTMFDVLAR